MLKSIISVLFFFLLFNLKAVAQQETVQVPASLLLRAVNKAETHVMFKIKDNKLYILDQDRKALYPRNYQAPDYEVFYIFTVDYVRNYIKQAETKKIKLTSDFSGAVTFGDSFSVMTMDAIANPCPPACPK